VPTVRWGLLTTARINDAIIRGAGESGVAEIVAVASRDAARAEAYARERGIARAHGSYDDLLADPDVDVVYVALPSALHVEWSIRALDAGKHVLCEKPLTRVRAEAERAFDAAERNGRVLMEGFMYRHQEQARRLQALVRDGAIGELRLARAAFSFALDRPDDVRWSRELGGGSLLDLGCYCTNALRLVAGEPEWVSAEQTLAATGVDVRFAATLRFPGGVLGHFDCGFDLPERRVVEVLGSEGSVTLEPAFASDEGVLELRTGAAVDRIELPPTNRYALQVENVSRAALGEEPPLLDRRETVAQAAALEALFEAAESGSRVSPVPPA
jgi:predicted dehydrogenase